jgi:hypothetical protein
MSSKTITISVQGAIPTVQTVAYSTVGELKAALNLQGYTVTSRLVQVDDSTGIEDMGFYTFTKQVKGA